MTWAEKLIKEFNKQKHREEVNSGQHKTSFPLVIEIIKNVVWSNSLCRVEEKQD